MHTIVNSNLAIVLVVTVRATKSTKGTRSESDNGSHEIIFIKPDEATYSDEEQPDMSSIMGKSMVGMREYGTEKRG